MIAIEHRWEISSRMHNLAKKKGAAIDAPFNIFSENRSKEQLISEVTHRLYKRVSKKTLRCATKFCASNDCGIDGLKYSLTIPFNDWGDYNPNWLIRNFGIATYNELKRELLNA